MGRNGGVLMLRSSRASSGPFAVIFACSLAAACSSTGSGSHAAGGAASNEGDSASAGHDTSAGHDASVAGASQVGTNAGGASTGGVDSSLAGTGNDPGSAGASGSDAASSVARRIFYLDVQGRVLSFDEDKPSPRTLVSSAGQGPDGIAVDAAGGRLFWTTMGVPADDDGSLRRSELDGSMVTTIVAPVAASRPNNSSSISGNQQLYWSDREGMRIQRAAIDGSDIETLVTVASGASARKNAQNWCVGLALDLVHGFVYWTQKGPDNGMVGSIRRAHLQLPERTDRHHAQRHRSAVRGPA